MGTITVGKNIWYLTLNIILTSIFTYIFWFFTARVAGPQAIGASSYLVSLSLIIATIAVLDMSLGMKRSLGMAVSDNDLGKFKQILSSTIVFVSIVVCIIVLLLEIPTFHLLDLLKIGPDFRPIFIASIAITPYQFIFTEALIAGLRANNLLLPLVLGATARFPVLIIAVYFFNAPDVGVFIAYASLTFIVTSFYAYYSVRIFKGANNARATENILSHIKHVLKAGLASWFPHIIYVLGSQLGIVTVVATSGATEGGKYYLAMGIFLVSLFIVMGVSRVVHSSISSISDKKEQVDLLTSYMRLAFIFTMPLAAPLLFFSKDFLMLMGPEYGSASSVLTILIIALPLSIISEMIYYFIYGRGDHRLVLYLGIAGNVPRIVLYFILPPILGIEGAAIAYAVGSAIQVAASIHIQRHHQLVMEFRKYAILTVIPLSIGFAMWILDIHFILSTFVIVVGSIVVHVRMHLLSDSDLHNVLYTILPLRRADTLYPTLSKLMKKIS